jgi:hypothetical protein
VDVKKTINHLLNELTYSSVASYHFLLVLFPGAGDNHDLMGDMRTKLFGCLASIFCVHSFLSADFAVESIKSMHKSWGLLGTGLSDTTSLAGEFQSALQTFENECDSVLVLPNDKQHEQVFFLNVVKFYKVLMSMSSHKTFSPLFGSMLCSLVSLYLIPANGGTKNEVSLDMILQHFDVFDSSSTCPGSYKVFQALAFSMFHSSLLQDGDNENRGDKYEEKFHNPLRIIGIQLTSLLTGGTSPKSRLYKHCAYISLDPQKFYSDELLFGNLFTNESMRDKFGKLPFSELGLPSFCNRIESNDIVLTGASGSSNKNNAKNPFKEEDINKDETPLDSSKLRILFNNVKNVWVLAKCSTTSFWYDATISKVNSDGTYDVLFDLGEELQKSKSMDDIKLKMWTAHSMFFKKKRSGEDPNTSIGKLDEIMTKLELSATGGEKKAKDRLFRYLKGDTLQENDFMKRKKAAASGNGSKKRKDNEGSALLMNENEQEEAV